MNKNKQIPGGGGGNEKDLPNPPNQISSKFLTVRAFDQLGELLELLCTGRRHSRVCVCERSAVSPRCPFRLSPRGFLTDNS